MIVDMSMVTITDTNNKYVVDQLLIKLVFTL